MNWLSVFFKFVSALLLRFLAEIFIILTLWGTRSWWGSVRFVLKMFAGPLSTFMSNPPLVKKYSRLLIFKQREKSWLPLSICQLSLHLTFPVIPVFGLSYQTAAPQRFVTHALVSKTFAQWPLGKLIVYRALSKRLQFICPGHTCLSVSVCFRSLAALETDMGHL